MEVRSKSSCYPCCSHVAALVNQGMSYLGAASFHYTPHTSDSCMKLPKIYKAKADSESRGRRLPPSDGKRGAML